MFIIFLRDEAGWLKQLFHNAKSPNILSDRYLIYLTFKCKRTRSYKNKSKHKKRQQSGRALGPFASEIVTRVVQDKIKEAPTATCQS